MPLNESSMEEMMSRLHPRMKRELKTVELMIAIYCKDHHKTGHKLCDECQRLLEYARLRLGKCPFQENKTTCGNCPIHCYRPEMREKVRAVMKYAGPRMAWHHPWLALGHVFDGRRKKPGAKKKSVETGEI